MPSRDTDRLADAAGITQRWAETAPEKRGGLVAELQEQGRIIAIVGPCTGQAEAPAEAALSVGDDPASDITMRDFDVSLVADAFSLTRRLPRALDINRIITLVALVLALPLAVFTDLHWAVPATILATGLVAVSLQSTRVRAGIGVYPPPPKD
ncbi:hypothetical protein [Nocardioides sp. AE5]|uniref:hypothetical protein n=1 Tax=Nocardioides sp. AE5 TaxID=2962573 RepID=UPI0028826F35|nr:hypothetical protein [Nocardioides sp. AE5]MDT0203724.1 hypothetical protein [Nocardioides sp. AE5]